MMPKETLTTPPVFCAKEEGVEDGAPVLPFVWGREKVIYSFDPDQKKGKKINLVENKPEHTN